MKGRREGGNKEREREREQGKSWEKKNIGEKDGEGRMSADSRGGGVRDGWTEGGGTKRRRGGMDVAGG